jgi:hypothetical protein
VRRINPLDWLAEQDLLAARYYWLPLWQRLILTASSILTLLSSAYTLYVTLEPLYKFQGGFVEGYIAISRYHLLLFNHQQVKVPPLDSAARASFALILGSLFSTALALPALTAVARRRIARIYIEAAAAGYVVAGLTLALLHSFLRFIYVDVIPLIPRSASYPTSYGSFSFHSSTGWYTGTGLLTLKLWNYVPAAIAALIAAGGAAVYLLLRYYEDLVETPPRIPHGS